MNVQGIAGPLPPALPAAVLPQASALPTGAGPLDQVALSGMPLAAATRKKKAVKSESEPEVKQPTPAVPITLTEAGEPAITRAEPAEEWALNLRRAYRREDVPALYELRSQLLEGKLEGKEFQEAARLVVDMTHGSEDQLTARIARRILYDRFRWPQDDLTDLKVKVGHPKGCTQQLRGKLSVIDGHSADRTYHPEDGAVSQLLKGLESAVPDQQTILTVARVGRAFFERSQMELKPEIREHESPELDRSLGQRAEGLLQKWHREGHFTWEGETTLQHGRIEVWPGPVLKMVPESPKKPGAESSGLHQQLDRAWKDEEQLQVQDQLAELWRQDRPEAERLIARLVAEQPEEGRAGSRRLNVALGGAARHPELKTAFTPHLENLTGLIRLAQARDEVGSNNLVGHAQVDFVRNLSAAFPEVVTPEWYQGEVLPLVLSDEINTSNDAAEFIGELLAGRPELRDLTMQAAIEVPNDFYLDHCCRTALSACVKNGWTPTPLQKDWLVSWLHVPYEPEKTDRTTPLLFDEGFRAALKACSTLLEKDPRALDGCELPDTKGQMVSVATAVADRLVHEDSDYDSFSRRRSPDLYRVLESDPRLKAGLFQRAEQDYPTAGSLAGLKAGSARSLHLLAELAQKPSDRERLATLLSQEDTRNNGRFQELVNQLVRNPERARLKEALAREDITASEAVTRGSRDLLLTMHQSRSGSRHSVSQAMATMQEATARCTPVARREQAHKLHDKLLPALRAAQTQEKLSLEKLGELAVLGALGAQDAEVRPLMTSLLPELDRLGDAGYDWNFRAVREAISEHILSGLSQQIKQASPEEQRQLVQEATPWGGQLAVVLEAWKEVWQPPAGGPGNLGWLERGFACLRQPEGRAAWVRETLELRESGGWPEGTDYASWQIGKPLYKETLKTLQQPGLSPEERAANVSLASDLLKLTRDDSKELAEAFLVHAVEWEKSLMAAHGEHFSEAVGTYAAVVSAQGDKEQNWKLVSPLLGRLGPEGYPHLAEAVRLGGDLPGGLGTHLDDFSYLLGRLGPENSGDALSVFIHLKQIEAEGMPHDEALNVALAAYINPTGETEVASGVRDTGSSVIMGGIALRKKARS